MVNPRTTLLISTYNRPDALSACLASVARLVTLPDEVVIADDGSGEPTNTTIEYWKERLPVPVIHVWHEDRGFRLAAIRNKAIARSSGEYIIQIDGDELLHPRFIADHLRYACRGSFAKGCRVKLNKEYSEKLCVQPARKPSGIYSLRSNIEEGWLKGMRLRPLAWWFANRFKPHVYYALGGNMGFWKEDLIKINGYDERFEGWGREDDDLAHRLGRSGLRKRDLRFTAVCYHLWHPENSRALTDRNDDYIKEQDRLNIVRCEDGLDKYL